MNRPIFLLLVITIIAGSICRSCAENDRNALVSKHSILNSATENLNPVIIGNGKYIFPADITGLQTFNALSKHDSVSEDHSEWCFDIVENQEEYFIPQNLKSRLVHGRSIEYFSHAGVDKKAVRNEFSEPANDSCHNDNPGIIGLLILKQNGEEISMTDIREPLQKLDLWTGELDSRYNIEGTPVRVKTVCHSDYDMISVKISSALIGMSRLKIKMNFPSWTDIQPGSGKNLSNSHTTEVIYDTNNVTILERTENSFHYYVLVWRNDAIVSEVSDNGFLLTPGNQDSVYSFSCQFMKNRENGRIQTFGETETASRKSWEKFWTLCSYSDIRKLTENMGREEERLLIISKYMTEQRYLKNVKIYNNK